MTEDEWETLAAWLKHGDAALMSADELRELFADRNKVLALVRELRANRFGAARPHYSPHK